MAWRWVGVPKIPAELEHTWHSQGDAETWLGENWRALLDRGVATVTLFDGENEVYGPMGLAAP